MRIISVNYRIKSRLVCHTRSALRFFHYMDDRHTPVPNIIRDPPSLPASPEHKRTKVLDYSAPIIDEQAVGRTTPTPLPHALNMASQIPALQVQLLSHKAKAPTRGSAFAAGYDLYSSQDTVVPARGKAMVETDISIAVPEGTYGRVAPRSGLAAKHSIDTGAGVIDYDYRGPVKVILFNFSDMDFKISQGDRIAQLVLERIVTPDVVVVETLSETVRGTGGFGSTGGFTAVAVPPA